MEATRLPLTTRAESSEAAALWDTVNTAATDPFDYARARAARLGGGVVLSAAADPSGYLNKALGFGITEPFTADVADAVRARWEGWGTQHAVLQVAPSALPSNWEREASRLGFRRAGAWVQMIQPVPEPSVPVPSTLHVDLVPGDQIREWARVLLSGFGPYNDAMLRLYAEASGVAKFAVWDGARMIAAGKSSQNGDTVQLHGAATLEEHRRRGAQSLLIEARMRHAYDHGAKWVSVQTFAETPLSPNPSLHNLRRAGFWSLYERINWRWSRR